LGFPGAARLNQCLGRVIRPYVLVSVAESKLPTNSSELDIQPNLCSINDMRLDSATQGWVFQALRDITLLRRLHLLFFVRL